MGSMPPTISNLSLRQLEEIRLREQDLDSAQHPVWIHSRMATGYFPALELRRLIGERDDLGYLGKLTRNADQGPVPGFTFVREGAESFTQYCRALETASSAPSRS
jgi:hypothetical protein